MSRGYILLHRSIVDHYAFRKQAETDKGAFIDLLILASYQPHKIRYRNSIISVNRGQVPISYRKLASRWKWSVNTVRHFLGLLEQEGMISLKTDTQFLVITICNYNKYQSALINTDTVTDTLDDTVADTLTDTNRIKGKEIKEKKESKKVLGSRFTLTQLPEDWRLFCQQARVDLDAEDTFQQFSDYWMALAGQKGTKLDWLKTWRNWVRNQKRPSAAPRVHEIEETTEERINRLMRKYETRELQQSSH